MITKAQEIRDKIRSGDSHPELVMRVYDLERGYLAPSLTICASCRGTGVNQGISGVCYDCGGKGAP